MKTFFDEENIRLFTFAIEDSQKLKEERAIVHYITTNTKDWGGDVIHPEGMTTENFEKYRTVFYNHNYSLPIASNLWLKRDEKGWLAKTRFASKNAFAEDIYNLYLEDIIKTWSVGIMIPHGSEKYDEKEKTNHITSSVLYEYSAAPLAANFDAIDQNKSLLKSVEAQRFIEEFKYLNVYKGSMDMLKKEISDLAELYQKRDEEILRLSEMLESQSKELLLLSNEISKKEKETVIKSVEIVGKPDLAKLAREAVSGAISELTGRK